MSCVEDITAEQVCTLIELHIAANSVQLWSIKKERNGTKVWSFESPGETVLECGYFAQAIAALAQWVVTEEVRAQSLWGAHELLPGMKPYRQQVMECVAPLMRHIIYGVHLQSLYKEAQCQKE